MPEKYRLKEPGKTMFVFERNGKYYGHIVKDRTAESPARLIFETPKFDDVEQLKKEYPEN